MSTASTQPSVRRTLGWAALGCGSAAMLIGLTVAPPENMQGEAARLLYVHVPAAWTAYLCYFAVLIASVKFLRGGGPQWDRTALAAAEIGVAMTALTIAVGSVWGRAVWGVWWAWDPRLVSTALLFLVYTGYLAWRRVDTAGERRAAWLGIAGVALIPVVHFSVVWWRSLHQPATLLAPSTRPPIDAVMAATLALAVTAFTLGAAWLFLRRVARLNAPAELRRTTSLVAP